MGEWQPIDTAPKQGYVVGVWRYGSRWAARVLYWNDVHDEWTDVHSDLPHKPIYWVLPPDTSTGDGS